MKILFLISLTIIAALNPGRLNAETPEVVIRPLPDAKPAEKVVDDDILLLRLEIAENGYTVTRDRASKERLLGIYEKVVFTRCLSRELQNLSGARPETDDICLEYIEKILNFDPGNVVAYCAREGSESASCRAASERQKVRTFNPKEEEQMSVASVDDVIESRVEGPKIKEATRDLRRELSSLNRNTSKTASTDKKRSIMQRILTLNCRNSRIKLEEKDIPAETPKEQTSSLVPDDSILEKAASAATPTPRGDDPLSNLLNENFATPTPTVTLPESPRIYEISSECQDYIEEFSAADPIFAAPHCFKWGYYSTQCLDARRREGKVSSGASAGSSDSTPKAFEKF